jgi:hypothetical protein
MNQPSEPVNVSPRIKYAFGLGLSIVALGIIVFMGYAYFNPERGVRSWISRVKGEQNQIATALENYFIDYHRYPLPDYDNAGNPVIPKSLISSDSSARYLSNLSKDPFSDQRQNLYRYASGPPGSWDKYYIVTSCGPDKKGNINVMQYDPDKPNWKNLAQSPLTYDPTNGIISAGDLWRCGP